MRNHVFKKKGLRIKGGGESRKPQKVGQTLAHRFPLCTWDFGAQLTSNLIVLMDHILLVLPQFHKIKNIAKCYHDMLGYSRLPNKSTGAFIWQARVLHY